MTTPSWNDWEDFQAGLYALTSVRPDVVASSVDLLARPDEFLEVAREMVREWANAAEHNIVHLWTGRRAWIGQASCCYAHGATAAETREAWGKLSNQDQRAANEVADDVADRFRKEVMDGAETLFDG